MLWVQKKTTYTIKMYFNNLDCVTFMRCNNYYILVRSCTEFVKPLHKLNHNNFLLTMIYTFNDAMGNNFEDHHAVSCPVYSFKGE